MKNLKQILSIGLVLMLFVSATSFAETYYSTGSVAPNTLTNWNSNRDGTSGTTPANFTTSGDIFVVQGTGGGSGSPHTMIITATWTIGAGVTVQVEGGAILQSATTFSITFATTSTFQLDAGATYNHNTAVAYASTVLNGVENFATTSNFVILNSATTGPGTPTNGFGNLTVNPTGLTGSVNSSGALTNIKGNLTIIQTGGGTYEFRLTGATALTLNIGGNLDIQGGIFTLGNGTADPIVNLSGNFIMSGGQFNHIATGGSASVNKIGTINFNKSGVQTFTKTGGSITANTSSYRRISFVVLSSSIIDMGTNILDCATNATVDFTVNSGGTVRLGDPGGIVVQGTLPTTGNIRTTASSIRSFSTGGNYEYTGTTSQVTGDGLPATVNNLTINNAAGLSLIGSTTVNGTLTLTAGNISTGSNTLAIGSSGIVNRTSGYVVGNLQQTFSSTGNKKFDVGTANGYSPVTVDATAGTGNFTVKAIQGAHPQAYNADVLQRYWTLTNADITSADLTFEYLAGDVVGTETNYIIGRFSDPDWFFPGGSVNPTTHTASITGVTTFSDWTMGEQGSLPVQLASFVGNIVGNNAQLEWETISELNNYGFNVQRLNNISNNYETIGFVAGKGVPYTYTYEDENVSGSLEYRLEQIDNDGLTSYFGPIMLNPNSVGDDAVPAVFELKQNYPNPFNPSTVINYQLAIDNYTTLKVYNLIGKEVATLVSGNQSAGSHQVTFDGSALTSGIYFYKLQSGSSVEVKKLTLVK